MPEKERLFLNFFKINIFPNLGAIGMAAGPGTFRSRMMGRCMRFSRGPGRTGAGRIIHLLPLHLAELLPHMLCGPENGDQEARNKTVQEIEKNGQENNIHTISKLRQKSQKGC